MKELLFLRSAFWLNPFVIRDSVPNLLVAHLDGRIERRILIQNGRAMQLSTEFDCLRAERGNGPRFGAASK